MIVNYVPSEFVLQVWKEVAPFLEESCRYTDDYDVTQVQTLLSLGHWHLFIARRDLVDTRIVGASTVNFYNYPRKRVAFVTAIGGQMIAHQDGMNQLMDLLKEFGATHIQGGCRPAMERLLRHLGMHKKYTVVERKII